jgi:acylphosphatase
VWFRDECQRHARSEHVHGWVRNLVDGRVEAVFEGADDAVDRLVAWCRDGPRRAHVTDVEVRREQPVGEVGYRIR